MTVELANHMSRRVSSMSELMQMPVSDTLAVGVEEMVELYAPRFEQMKIVLDGIEAVKEPPQGREVTRWVPPPGLKACLNATEHCLLDRTQGLSCSAAKRSNGGLTQSKVAQAAEEVVHEVLIGLVVTALLALGDAADVREGRRAWPES